ncbi:MAG: hypothetical protein CVU38_12970 [Chloroflexi bacterium HGW-Chloroflexi-1]|nr:MAG: hypothetical protein CVU38_12970 [Chloroflexi bacterium HGW-Chloroflexi-1]
MSLANWRDLSIVLLAIEAFIISLAPAVLFYLCVRGISWVLEQIRTYAPQVQGYFRQGAEIAENVSQKIAAPFVAISAAAAQVRRWRSALSSSQWIQKGV